MPDLFFATRIAATATLLGVALETPPPPDAVEAIRRGLPDLVIIDLGAGEALMAIAEALKADPATRSIPIVGFYPHVEGAIRTAGLAAGVEHVLPRSAFTERLAALLAGEGGTQP